MITLPPGFDMSLFNSDLVAMVTPFAGIAFLFTVYRVVKKIMFMM